ARNRPHFDGAVRRGRAACGPLERRIKCRQFQNREAAELFLGVRVRTVLDQALAVLRPDSRARVRLLQGAAADENAGLEQSLVPRLPRACVAEVLGGIPAPIEVVRAFIDQQGKLHRSSPFAVRRTLSSMTSVARAFRQQKDGLAYFRP